MTRYRTIVADPPWPIGQFPAGEHERARGETAAHETPYSTMPLSEIAALPVGDLAAPEAHLYLWTIADHLRASYEVAEGWGFQVMYPLVWCKRPLGHGLGGKFASNVEFVLFCRERHGAVRITSYLADCAKARGVTVRDVNKKMGTSDMAGWWLSRLPHRARLPMWDQWLELKEIVGADDRYDADVRLVNDHRNDSAKVDTRWFAWPRGPHSQKPEAFLDMVEQVSPGPYLEMFARRQRLGWDTWGNEALNHVEMGA